MPEEIAGPAYPRPGQQPNQPRQQQAGPSPTPSGGGLGPYSGGTALTPGLQSPSQTPDGSTTNVKPGTPPADFVTLAKRILTTRIGVSSDLIPSDQLNALILKMWNDSVVQADYQQFKASPATYTYTLEQQIQYEIGGLGEDPTIAADYANLKQQQGKGLTLSEQAALANVTQAQGAMIPRPFMTNTVSGYDFGAPMPAGGWDGAGHDFGWPTHMGVDYGTAAGSRIVSPFAGTVSVETGVAGYGNIVYVTLDNGWKIGFGHVAQGFANGERVNPGDLIAISGKDVGSAKGAVTIVVWQDPQGKFHDPHRVLDPIFTGMTFGQIRDDNGNPVPALAGTGMPTVNKILDTEYPTIKSDWQALFGSPPSPEDVYNVLEHGKSPGEWTDYIRSLPSHIEGLGVGQAADIRASADQVSQKMYGHASTDGIVKELYDQNLTNPIDVKYFYDMLPGKDIPKADYNAIYQANQSTMDNIFNDTGLDPRVAQRQFEEQGRRGGPQAI
jgi:murein DD-endopeptidase MepM/ murein hydrolase activator NlpD